MRSRIILGSFVVFFAWLLWWVFNHGFIDVRVETGASGTAYTYTVLDKSGYEVSRTESDSSHFRKLVRKGTYQILVENKSGSEYRLINTGGFLSKTKTTANLQPERAREFVGNNPGFCMNYDGSLLYSYSCSEPGSLATHLPATADTPTTTYTEPTPTIPLKALVNYAGFVKAMVIREDEAGGGVTLNDLSPQLQLSNPTPLKGVEAENADYIQPYKQGFIVYGRGLGVVNYFSSPASQPRLIKSVSPSEDNTNPVELTVYKGSLGALFNSTSGGNDEGLSEDAEAHETAGSSEYLVYGDSPRSYKFDKAYTAGGLCGDNWLCLINSGQLDMYRLSGSEAKLEFSLQDVQSVFNQNGAINIITSRRVISLNLSSLLGYVQYSFGSALGYCGSGPAPNGYVLCVVDSKDKPVALHINTGFAEHDKIDQKVFALLKDPNINSVSAYKNYLYVSPNLGEMMYDPAQRGYVYSQEIKRSTTKAINELVRRLGIDTSKYIVINPYATN